MNYRRYFNYILQLSWPFLSNIIISKFEKTDPILKGNREGKRNTCDFDGNGSNPSDISGHDSGSVNEPQNSDDI